MNIREFLSQDAWGQFVCILYHKMANSLLPAEPARVEALFEAAVDALEHFSELCVKKESDNAQIAVKNGGVEVSLDAYQALKTYRLSWGSSALRILHALLQGNSNVPLFFPLTFFLCC